MSSVQIADIKGTKDEIGQRLWTKVMIPMSFYLPILNWMQVINLDIKKASYFQDLIGSLRRIC
jgi:hypothetical protein